MYKLCYSCVTLTLYGLALQVVSTHNEVEKLKTHGMSCSATIVYSVNDGYDQINAAAVVLEI